MLLRSDLLLSRAWQKYLPSRWELRHRLGVYGEGADGVTVVTLA